MSKDEQSSEGNPFRLEVTEDTPPLTPRTNTAPTKETKND